MIDILVIFVQEGNEKLYLRDKTYENVFLIKIQPEKQNSHHFGRF